jgi:aldehyde:ferredoxin oxidoreductase
MKKYHELGTAQNVASLNKLGGLPTRNLKEGSFESADALSGENLAANYLGRRLACSHCPVACIHIAALREPYENEPYFYKTSMISYDYEPIYAIGSMLGLGDVHGFLRLMDAVEKAGIDVMSVGVVLAWATEALERGDISDRETMGLKLAWGDWRTYCEAVERIVEQPNDFYAALARGVEHASGRYGGRDYALSFGGNEMAGYHTGPAGHVGLLVGARHSHLDNAGYSIDQKVLVKESMTPEQLAAALFKEESWRQVLASLVVCFFSRGIYKTDVVRNALRITGFDLNEDALTALGAEILRDKYRFKFREGFVLEDIRIPRRILETSAPVKGWGEDFMRKAVGCFADSLSVG